MTQAKTGTVRRYEHVNFLLAAAVIAVIAVITVQSVCLIWVSWGGWREWRGWRVSSALRLLTQQISWRVDRREGRVGSIVAVERQGQSRFSLITFRRTENYLINGAEPEQNWRT